MRQIPNALAAAALDQASEPLVLVACWAERGPESRLVAPSQLAGSGDPAAADDANVTTENGALVLAAGNAVAMDAAATVAGASVDSVWQGKVTEVGQWVWA